MKYAGSVADGRESTLPQGRVDSDRQENGGIWLELVCLHWADDDGGGVGTPLSVVGKDREDEIRFWRGLVVGKKSMLVYGDNTG